MRPGPASSSTIEALLPDCILETVFESCLAGVRRQTSSGSGPGTGGSGASSCSNCCCTAAALPLVCRRWHRVFNTSQLLHGTLNLDLRQLEAQLRSQDDLWALLCLLAQRGQAARRLWLHSEGVQLRMATVLQLVSPQLRAVYLGAGAPPDSLAQLCRFPALRSLDLPAAAYAAEGALLSGLSQLEELSLREGAPAQLLSSLACLPRLRMLSLTLVEEMPAACHRLLAQLRHLEELHLYLLPSEPTQFEFHPGVLAELSSLRSVLLMAPSALCETLIVGPGLSRLEALQELQVESRVEALPPDLWSCRHLTRLDLDLKGSPLPPPRTPGAPCLPSLAELRLARCRLPGGALPPVLCQLSGLRRLEVAKCGLTAAAGGCAASAGLPQQFSRLTNLEHLSLEGNALCTLPPAVAALPALRHLDLSCNLLAWLPAGPYLRSLETLILSANRLTMMPPALAGASQLEVLDLSGHAALELSKHDVDATLARMPRLALLLLGKQAALCSPMPGMPGAATLGFNPAGAGSGLEWRTPSVAALVALGQALPHLQIDFEHTAKEYEGI